jgi:(p)ppGpp synthase/HD superfamily hydrolase
MKSRDEPADIEKALRLMLEAHCGQRDKSGQPYVLHPIRVMMRLSAPEDRIAALLHDVVEDTDVTLEQLAEAGFSTRVIDAVDHLTRREGETYPEFIGRVRRNEIAARVKISDLQDNIDITRLASLEEKDVERLKRYHAALLELRSAADGRG